LPFISHLTVNSHKRKKLLTHFAWFFENIFAGACKYRLKGSYLGMGMKIWIEFQKELEVILG